MTSGIKRRTLLQGILASPFIFSSTKIFSQPLIGKGPVKPVTIRLNSSSHGNTIGSSITGLSYELAEIKNPDFFSEKNQSLISLINKLGRNGVLRIGGNTSDNAIYDEYNGTIPEPTIKVAVSPKSNFHFTKEDLHRLKGFVDAIGWTLIFGINMKINCPKMGAVLAKDLQEIFSDRLLAIQIGNEPNNYRYIESGRQFDFDTWYRLQRVYVAEIEKVASLPVAAPDTGANTDWLKRYYELQKNTPFVSRHYYKGSKTQASVDKLLETHQGFFNEIRSVTERLAGTTTGLRLTEVNSYYLGGADGVSNTYVSCLWGLDYIMQALKVGTVGINFHGGTLDAVESSLGSSIRPEQGMNDTFSYRRSLSSRYSPVAGNSASGFSPMPLFYAMLIGQQFASSQLIETRADSNDLNISAFAAVRSKGKDSGQVLLLIVNKDQHYDAQVSLSGTDGAGTASIYRLSASSEDEKAHIHWDMDSFNHESGEWSTSTPESLPLNSGETLLVRRMSACLVITDLD
ncbi:hypothetical protein [uncultured Pluralibacter sp.]|uniref:hypothetical protein n=1 Tax=uncultured Pluralibacter sp. TaxID=1490864 RepID=UPI00261AB3E3|nr:hypothetical protein [uncultured Pluralibacter sp.]